MASLTVKGIPENLLDALRRHAATQRRSLNNEVIVLLERAILSVDLDADDVLARIRANRARLTNVTPLTEEMIDQAIGDGRP